MWADHGVLRLAFKNHRHVGGQMWRGNQPSPNRLRDLKDMGFNVELTKATRDGGRDIIAHVSNSLCSYLTHIECKKYATDNKIGVGIIREVMGVHNIRQATKSIIVTTSFFSKDAIKEAEIVGNHLDLKDFNDLKCWLQKY